MLTDDPKAFWNGISKQANWIDYILPKRSSEEFEQEGKAQADDVLRRAANPKVTIEYGCGIGRLSKYFAASTERMIGLDICQDFVDKAKEIDKVSEYYQTDEFKEEGVADFVYSVSVMQHNTMQSCRLALDHIYRMLKDGGTCFITFAHGDAYTEGAFVHKFTEAEVESLAARFRGRSLVRGNLVRYGGRAFKHGEVNEIFLIATK